jgi:hypothetical protein
MMEKITPRKLLHDFYKENHLSNDGGNSLPYVKIEATPFCHFYIPNFNARRKAVPLHDIHHMVTGYTTRFRGECEISAWEIGSGCRRYWAAFLIDTSGVMIGVLLNPTIIMRAYARGRRTKNLYHETIPFEKALDMDVEELKHALDLNKVPADCKATPRDFFSLLAFLIFGSFYSLLSLLTLPLVGIYTVFTEIRVRKKECGTIQQATV